MIRITNKEYRDGELVVREISIILLFIPIIRYRKTSTNSIAVAQFTPIKEPTKIKGYIRHETEN